MKRVLGLAVVAAAAFSLAAPASAHEICVPLLNFTGRPLVCVDAVNVGG